MRFSFAVYSYILLYENERRRAEILEEMLKGNDLTSEISYFYYLITSLATSARTILWAFIK